MANSDRIKYLAFEHRLFQVLISLGMDEKEIRQDLRNGAPNRLDRLRHLVELASNRSENPYLAVETGQMVTLASYGILGYNFMQSRNLEELFNKVQKNMWVLDPTEKNALKLHQDKAEYLISYSNPPHWPEAPYFYIDLFFSALLHQSRELSRQPLSNSTLHLRRPVEHIPSSFPEMLGIRVVGNAKTDCLSLPINIVQKSFPANNPFHSPTFHAQCDALLRGMKKESTLVEKVRHSLLLQSDGSNLETLAAECGMSSRTMRRQLASHGTSFRQIQKEMLVHLSKEYLLNTPLSIADIAEVIGYHDASTYSRAFKQVTSQTPAQFKNAQNKSPSLQ